MDNLAKYTEAFKTSFEIDETMITDDLCMIPFPNGILSVTCV